MPQNDAELEGRDVKDEVPNLKDFDQRLRDEAAVEPSLEVPQGEPTSKTQIIAIYGKAALANPSRSRTSAT